MGEGGGTWIEKWSPWIELCETWMAFMNSQIEQATGPRVCILILMGKKDLMLL